MPATLICHGVMKSGSPMVRETVSFEPCTSSKNFRIPDGFSDDTFSGIILP